MKREKIKVAITGGIGSGKSTVVRYLQEKGFPVFSCDEIYKEIYSSNEYQSELAAVFPDCLIDGKIEKKLLTQKVFSDAEALKKLNKLAHMRIMSALYERMGNTPNDIAFAEVPLLFEGEYENNFDKIIVVMRSREARIQAVALRDGVTAEAVQRRMDMQFNYNDAGNVKTLKERGCFIIENNSTEDNLQKQVDNFLLTSFQ